MGYTNEQIYKLSKKIISGERNAGMFGEAYNLSYTDIYDFASASNKMSLKKLEIKMGIHHQELGMDWDQPVPEDKWPLVAGYCCNDVDATEAAFHYLNADWTAREILADIAGMTVNDTTNSLTTKIIFGNNKHPQDQFNYRNLAEDDIPIKPGSYVIFNSKGQPVFPGYKFERGVSTYRGEEVGEVALFEQNRDCTIWFSYLQHHQISIQQGVSLEIPRRHKTLTDQIQILYFHLVYPT